MNLIASRRNEPQVKIERVSDTDMVSNRPHRHATKEEAHPHATKEVNLQKTAKFSFGTYETFDVDKDGYIDSKEAIQLASALGLTPEMDLNFFKKGAMQIDSVDTDRDNKISIEEWNKGIQILNGVT